MMKGVGVIGIGRHGSRYVRHIINDIDGMELRAVSRRSEAGREQSAEWGVVWYRDWKDLVADKTVDAVISVVPPAMNGEIAGACAQARKPLLLEKPLAVDTATATRIVADMEAAGCPLTVGQTLRYNPVIKSLKERLAAMGKVYSFAANQRLEPSSLAWHDEKDTAGAGVVIHTAIHVFDALRYITGRKIQRVIASDHRCRTQYLEDLVTVLVEMEDGTAGVVDISKVGNARSGRFEFVCREGHLYGEQIHGFIDEVRGGRMERTGVLEPVNAIVPLLREWGGFLDGRNPNPISGEEGLYAVRACEACLQSAAEKRWVDIGSVG